MQADCVGCSERVQASEKTASSLVTENQIATTNKYFPESSPQHQATADSFIAMAILPVNLPMSFIAPDNKT
jgi:hypothetical protein